MNHFILKEALPAALLMQMVSSACSQESVQPKKSLEIRRIETPLTIDGVIEPAWQTADTAVGFVQNAPYEKTAPTEPTTVYLLQDDENLYAAFRCYSFKHPPTANLTKDEDYVVLNLDPFGSRTNGYYF